MADASILETPRDSTLAWVAAEIAKEERERERYVRLRARGLGQGMQWTNEARARGQANRIANQKARKS